MGSQRCAIVTDEVSTGEMTSGPTRPGSTARGHPVHEHLPAAAAHAEVHEYRDVQRDVGGQCSEGHQRREQFLLLRAGDPITSDSRTMSSMALHGTP